MESIIFAGSKTIIEQYGYWEVAFFGFVAF
jgi:hypothetical protein